MNESELKFEFLMDFAQALSVVERPANKSLATILAFLSEAMSEGRLTAEKDLNSIFAVVDAADNEMSAEREYSVLFYNCRARQLAADEKAAKAHPFYRHVDSAIVLTEYEPSEDPDMYTYILRREWSARHLQTSLLAIAPSLFPAILGDPVAEEADEAYSFAAKKGENMKKAKAKKGEPACNDYAAAIMDYVPAVQKVLDHIADMIKSKEH